MTGGSSGRTTILFSLLLCGLLAGCDTISLDDSTPGTLLKVYGGIKDETGVAAVIAPDGGYYVLGTTASFGAGEEDFYLVRTDSRGVELWSRAYGGKKGDDAVAMTMMADGNLLMVGTTLSFGKGLTDLYAVKVDPNGDTLWTRTYGSSNIDLVGAVLAVDGGAIIAGNTVGFNAVNNDFYAVRIDLAGTMIWEKTYVGGADDYCTGITATREGYLLSGTIPDPTNRVPVIYLTRIDANGKYIFAKSVFVPKGSSSAAVATSDSTYVVFGHSRVSPTGEDSLLILKTNQTADVSQARNFGGGGSRAYDGIRTADGGLVAVGFSGGFGRGDDLFVIRTNADGALEWSHAYGGEQDDEGRAILQTPDGGYLLVGTTRSGVRGTNGSDILLLKTDATGALVD